jgi:hypothetical protein
MYCQLLEEATRQLKNEPKAARPEAHVDIGLSAFIPKTYIAADRQRMEMYRRLTRCASMEMLAGLESDMKDAFGEPPRQVILLLAMTEVRLLSQMYGIESVIKKDPDVVLTVHDAGRAQQALVGAPGTLRVIDNKTVYLRMPPTFLEPETLLMVMKNLMRGAHDREQRGIEAPKPEEAKAKLIAAAKAPKNPEPKPPALPAVVSKPAPVPPAKPAALKTPPAPVQSKDMEKLVSLRDQGILTQQEFQAALGRLAKK